MAKINSGRTDVITALEILALEFTTGTDLSGQSTTGIISGSGTLTLLGSYAGVTQASVWEAGEMTFTGSGGAVVASGATLTIATGNSHKLTGGSLTNLGQSTWTGGSINTGNGVTLANGSGATFTTDTDASLLNDQGGARAVFSNAGTFRKSGGSGTTLLEAQFDNTGSLEVSSGTVKLAGGGTSSGTITLANGGRVEISGNDYTFTGGTLGGNGTVEVSANTLSLGGTSGSANLTVSGTGKAKFTGNHSGTGSLTLSGGTIEGTSSETVSMSGGLNWTGGNITAARVQSTGAATIGAGSAK